MKRNYTASKIITSLNEGINTKIAPVVEDEMNTDKNTPTRVMQCDDCNCFYVEGEEVSVNESYCPECGGHGSVYGDIVAKKDEELDPPAPPAPDKKKCCCKDKEIKVTSENEDPVLAQKKKDLDLEESDEDEDELDDEADAIVEEALHSLDTGNYRRFNECYSSRVRVTTRGELEAIVESVSGKPHTARKKMTSRQKASYKLANTKKESCDDSEVIKESAQIQLKRQGLMMVNEARSIKLHACRVLERIGAKYNYKKFNESMDKYIDDKDYIQTLEDISQDDNKPCDLNNMTPDEISDKVSKVVGDTGLDVLDASTDIDGDSANVIMRIQDSPELEVHTGEIQDVLNTVFKGVPAEIIGPYESEGDSSVVKLSVILNPEVSESSDLDHPVEIFEEDDTDDDLDDDDMFTKKIGEKFVKDSEGSSLFALLSTDSSDDDPQFLAHDDSLISGNSDNAEDVARTFVSAEAANKYIKDAGLTGKFSPVPIKIVSSIDECDDPKAMKKMDKLSEKKCSRRPRRK